jgi:hypothetical protein
MRIIIISLPGYGCDNNWVIRESLIRYLGRGDKYTQHNILLYTKEYLIYCNTRFFYYRMPLLFSKNSLFQHAKSTAMAKSLQIMFGC